MSWHSQIFFFICDVNSNYRTFSRLLNLLSFYFTTVIAMPPRWTKYATFKSGESMATAEDDDKVHDGTNFAVSSVQVADIMWLASMRIVWSQTVVLLITFCTGFSALENNFLKIHTKKAPKTIYQKCNFCWTKHKFLWNRKMTTREIFEEKNEPYYFDESSYNTFFQQKNSSFKK